MFKLKVYTIDGYHWTGFELNGSIHLIFRLGKVGSRIRH